MEKDGGNRSPPKSPSSYRANGGMQLFAEIFSVATALVAVVSNDVGPGGVVYRERPPWRSVSGEWTSRCPARNATEGFPYSADNGCFLLRIRKPGQPLYC